MHPPLGNNACCSAQTSKKGRKKAEHMQRCQPRVSQPLPTYNSNLSVTYDQAHPTQRPDTAQGFSCRNRPFSCHPQPQHPPERNNRAHPDTEGCQGTTTLQPLHTKGSARAPPGRRGGGAVQSNNGCNGFSPPPPSSHASSHPAALRFNGPGEPRRSNRRAGAAASPRKGFLQPPGGGGQQALPAGLHVWTRGQAGDNGLP